MDGATASSAPHPAQSGTVSLLDGHWAPSAQIAYGIACASFLPVARVDLAPDGATVAREALNPHQVPLEVGDEVYVVEVFRPSRTAASSSASTTEDGVWFRGYVVSTAPHPQLPSVTDVFAFPSITHAAPALSQEPQVSLGIFPASHVQIREHLADDAERTLAQLAEEAEHDAAAASGARGARTARMARMEILQEEDEPEEDDGRDGDGSVRRTSRLVQLAPAGSANKSRNRSSVGSLATFVQQLSSEQRVAFQSSRLSKQSLPGEYAAPPPPPLPNLKCGDDTASGADEPLVDEIACALREWATLLYKHLYRRDYELFNTVRGHITALHAARKQLLAQTLSGEESSRLRRDAVARLAQSNVEQGLDVIVRHPQSGGLVEVGVEGDIDRSSWMSVIDMYAAQVALAYAAPMPEKGLAHAAGTASHASGLTPPSSTFHHVVLDVRSLVAEIAAPGELVELAFSLYAKADARFVTEEFAIAYNSAGVPKRDGPLRTLFRDLSQHDVSDQLFLVCRIVKNGPVKGGAGPAVGSPQAGAKAGFLSSQATRSHTASFDTTSSPRVHGTDDGSSVLFTDPSGRQSWRRPFGCAVLEISQFMSRFPNDFPSDSVDAFNEARMAVFVPVSEASFATLHEDIIHSRIKEIEKHPRAEHVAVGVRILDGDAAVLSRQLPTLLGEVPSSSRLSFPDVVCPGDDRNDVYVKLWSGDFAQSASSGGASAGGGGSSTVRSLAQLASAAGGGNAGSFEVNVEVRTSDGTLVERVLSRGTGESGLSQYTSTILRANNTPTWGELVKLAVPIDRMPDCHLFFTFRNRTARNSPDHPFAFAYFPLFPDASSAFQADGAHTLVLYRYDKQVATPSFYFQAPSVHDGARQSPALPPGVYKTLSPLRDTMTLRTSLVSTTSTQNETILRFLRWEQDLAHDPDLMRETLTKLTFCSEVEVCKFLRDIFDALFGILDSPANQAGALDDLVYQALVVIFGFVSDKRLTNFKPVLDLYISQSFSSSAAVAHIVGSLQRLLRNLANPEAAKTLRSSLKVLKWLLRLVVRSREIQRTREPGFGETASTLEAGFKADIASLLTQVNALMRTTTPSSIIGTQTLVLQHFPTILPELGTIFDVDELLEFVIAFVDSVGAVKGKMAAWKILCLREIVHSAIFATPGGRAALVPSMIRWVKPFLGKFDEYAMCSPKDPQVARDNARVSWIEGIRLATGVVAAMLDVVQQTLVDPGVPRNVLAQEHDNVEYLLALIPRLLEAYRELENLANLDAIERQRSPASIPAVVPTIFPATYPISLLAYPAQYARRQSVGKQPSSGRGGDPSSWPTLRTGIGEIACVFLALVQLAPRNILINWLESTIEVEGKDTFARQLGSVFRVARGILENEAFPADWLNLTALAHRGVLKLVEPAAEILERDFIPPPAASFKFNTALWRDFFSMLLELLASPQLLIEEFSPQKRRAVWRLAGDIRGEGAKILSHAWNAIAWPGEREEKHGLFQVQFVPALVEKVLALCLSHHDELRRVAVQILHSMIISEYDLNGHFAIIEAECIDKLDKLFGQQTKGDEISRAFFVAQLRQLFDDESIDDELRAQAAAFLASIDSFLDLLLAVRNLPEGEEYQEDRIISTLKLMSFIRGIGRSEIFVRYVQRLVSYHTALGDHTEAGLTLKLHADLHEWDLATFVDAVPDLDLPRQTEFARKETLYMRILEHLGKGQAYETAIDLVKELEAEYERTYNYPRLAELFSLKAELFAHIAKSDRHFGTYFRVAFYGSRWPMSISGKQFIYRGQGLETLGSFIERMMNKHPTATLLRSSNIPSEEIQYGENQFLQITAVQPEVDHSADVFDNPDVPHYVRAYYLHNEVSTFSFTRPLSKDASGRTRSTNDFTSLWTEKTVLICEDSFPTVLRRSEIVEIRLIEISPVENAVHDVQSKQKELATLERRYKALVQTEEDGRKINSNPLSMALNGACDAPVNQGIPMYRRVFLQPEFIATLPPSQVAIVRQLETAIDELVVTLAHCLKLHALIAPPEMRPFHETLERFFEKNFAAELARLPDQGSYEPASLSGASLAEPTLSGPRVYGSLLIGSTSTASLTAASGPSSAKRRESVLAHAMNDEVLLSHGAQVAPSPLTGAVTLSHPRAGSISGSTVHDVTASPTKSLFSMRSGSIRGPTAHGQNGHRGGSDAASSNGAPGRRASVLHSAVKKFGRRKGSEVAAVTEE